MQPILTVPRGACEAHVLTTEQQLTHHVACVDPFQRAHGPAYRLARIAEILRLQPEVAS